MTAHPECRFDEREESRPLESSRRLEHVSDGGRDDFMRVGVRYSEHPFCLGSLHPDKYPFAVVVADSVEVDEFVIKAAQVTIVESTFDSFSARPNILSGQLSSVCS